MKKRVLSLFLALTLCLTLLPTAVFAEGEGGGSMSGNTTIGGETGGTGGTGGGVLVGENEKTGGGFVVPSEQSGTVSAPVAKVGDTEYDTLQEILEGMDPAEITLLGNVTEDITVYAATTIHMDGHSIIGNVEVTLTEAGESLTLTNGTITGAVEVDGGTLTMTTPETAEAAITKGLNVISGSAYVSGAKIGVKGTLDFGGELTISGSEKAVALDKAAGPESMTFYGSTDVGGKTAEEASFKDGTYQVSGEVAKKLSTTQVGGSTPTEPVTLTLNPTSVDVAAGKTATFTVNYNGTGALNAYVQVDASVDYFTFGQTNNGNGTYTITVKIAEKTPTGDYTLYVHEVGNTFIQAKATINVISTVAKDDKGNYYTTIKDAIEKATDGSTITVIAAENRISLPDGIYVENQTGITLDLNGRSLDGCSLNVGGLTATSKVRTGKLTVVDSSGGNGAVGVTVRDGGEVEFRGSIATSCLQLQAYGGDVKFYGGNIRRFDLYSGVTYADFLPEGYCYYNYSGSGSDLGSIVTAADVANAVKVGHYLAVAPCSHGGANGFDINALTCPYCGAPAVAQTALTGVSVNPWRNFANLQDALDATRDGGSTLRLLANVTGDYTIDGTQTTGISLGDYVIDGTVTIKAATDKHNSVSFSSNRSNISITKMIAEKGANIYSTEQNTPQGIYTAIIGTLELSGTTMWEDILYVPDGYGYKLYDVDMKTYRWYTPGQLMGDTNQQYRVTIGQLPITANNLYLKVDGKNIYSSSVERGTTVQLCAFCNTSGADVSIFVGEDDGAGGYNYSKRDGTYTKIGYTNYYVVDCTFDTIGTYDIYFTASKDGYTVTSEHKTLTVSLPNLSKAKVTFSPNNQSVYDPINETTSAPPYTVTYNGKELKEDVDYTVTGNTSDGDVGTKWLTITAVEGGKYTGTRRVSWKIVAHKVDFSVGDVIKNYDGTTDLPADVKISFKSVDSRYAYPIKTFPLEADTDYILENAKYDSANASEDEKTISFTIKLKNKNYTFEDSTKQKTVTLNGADEAGTFKINQATIDLSKNEFTQIVFNDLAKTYEIDLKPMLDELLKQQKPNGVEYGSIKYQGCDYHFTDSRYLDGTTISVSNEGILTLPIVSAHTSNTGTVIGTLKANINTTNYGLFQLPIVVKVGEKITPVPAEGFTVSASDITYGQTLADSTLTATGSMICPRTQAVIPGTFAWTNKDLKPDASDSYDAEWTFTPDESYGGIYAAVTGKLTIKVNPKEVKITGITAADKVYDGTTAVTLDYSQATFEGKLDGDDLSVTATGAFVSADANSNFTRAVKLSNLELGGTDKDNYEISNEGSQVQTSAKINPATITVTPDAKSKTYGEDDPELTYTYSGAVNNETPAFTGALARDTGENVDNYAINKGTLALEDSEGFKASNYALVFSDTEVKFTIDRATYGDKTASGSAMYGNTGTVDLSGLIAEDGSAVINTGESKDNDRVINSVAVDSTTLKFEFVDDATKAGKTAKIVLMVRGATNYKDYTITITLTVNDKLTPVLDGELTLTPAEITYGDVLSKITITGTMKVGDTVVEGEFTWQYPDLVPDKAGTYWGDWKFTPKEKNTYTEATGKVEVVVNNVKQSATLVMEDYTYDEKPFTPYLKDRIGNMKMPVTYYYFSVDGGTLQTWDTKNPPALSAGTYTMRATIAGTQNYDEFTTADVQFTVAKATPDFINGTTYKKPTGLTATYGQTLADVTLSNPEGNLDGEWSWMDSEESVGNASTIAKTFKAKFTPKDNVNYNTVENIELEVTVNKADQATLTIQGEDSVAYGETLTLKTIGGTTGGKVTYSVDQSKSSGDASIDENGILTPTKVGTISVTATMAGDENYNDVTSWYFVISIKKGTPTGEPKYTEITTSSKTLKDAVLTTEGSTLNPKDGKLEWVDDEGDVLPGDTRVEANKTYKWRFTPTDTNYTTMTGEIELYHKSSSGGGSGSNSGSYTITVKDAQNGDVTTDRKSASAGTTVTITVKPDSGYVLDDLAVTDSKGNDIKLTGKGGGKYTFTMPSGKATVEASFTPAKSENPFTDVPSGAYYEDAVIWAVKNGITGGTSATTFDPNGFCTRAQAVTFLWRAAGSPAPKSTTMPFTDVPAGSYYYDAVLWAIENGVTKGTSDTTFSPNANCSRGQIVTFLWRSQMSPDAAAANPFTDVVADAYYTSAVLWAVERNITGGTSATTFSPSANCTRAQIVTFIYRYMK